MATFRHIALCGGIASGKSTLAELVAREMRRRGARVRRTSFAALLKRLATEVFGMPPERKDRALLIKLGAALRSVDRDVFVRATLREMRAEAAAADAGERAPAVWIVDDLRFANELSALRADSGVDVGGGGGDWMIVKVVAGERARSRRIAALYGDAASEHSARLADPSETALDHLPADAFDCVLNNEDAPDGGLAHARRLCDLAATAGAKTASVREGHRY